MVLLTTLALAIAVINPAGESEFDTNLNLNLGERYYIGAAAVGSEGSWYFKPGIAINMVDDTTVNATALGLGILVLGFETSTSLSLGFGVHVAENLRLEFGYFESENDISILGVATGTTLDQETFSFMALLDFDTDVNWTPYIGVGVVIIDSKLTAEGLTFSSDDRTLCLCAGIDWALSYNVDFSVEYRVSEPDFTHASVTNRTIFLGFKWIF